MSEDINVGAISEALNNKADRDLVNSIPPYLKTTYVNGTSGYNIWSNGYCEQWGTIPAGNNGVSFLKKFLNTNYNALVCGGDRNYNITYFVDSKTVNSMVAAAMTSTGAVYNSSVKFWEASGYLAEGEY